MSNTFKCPQGAGQPGVFLLGRFIETPIGDQVIAYALPDAG